MNKTKAKSEKCYILDEIICQGKYYGCKDCPINKEFLKVREQGKKDAVKRVREYIRKNCYTEDGFVSLYYLETILEELMK